MFATSPSVLRSLSSKRSHLPLHISLATTLSLQLTNLISMASNAPTAETTVDIYPHGDVILACGSDYGDGKITTLRVSAAVLGLGSPVFKAMFKPHFKEGTDLFDQLSGVPLLIKLPEDDPLAMEVICTIMHL